MRILIAGSHGGIGQRLTRLLREHGHEPVAMIRDPDQSAEMEALGGEPLVADLAGDVSDAPAGCDAVVFTAGAGPGSGAGPKQTIDRGGAEKLIAAAEAHRVRRYVMVSSIGAHDPDSGGDMQPYLEAKAQADEALRASSLDWTIIRPGGLTDDPGDGRVHLSAELGGRGKVSRDDVAAVLAAVLERDDAAGHLLELFDGDRDIAEALERVLR